MAESYRKPFLPVWAIVANDFTFHYALYVLMNWLPTHFEQGLRLGLREMGSYKMLPYLNVFFFSNIGGVVADHLITSRGLVSDQNQEVFEHRGALLFSSLGFLLFSTGERIFD